MDCAVVTSNIWNLVTIKKECEEVSTQKEIGEKLKKLQKILHTNDIAGKKSDCFWCTCPFDNPPIYIPARHRGENIECYGCFCSPECAVAYLCKENIDSSTRWERYSLLNNIYALDKSLENSVKTIGFYIIIAYLFYNFSRWINRIILKKIK